MIDLVTLFSKQPAALAWAVKEGRTIGASEGFLLDLWPDRAECVGVFARANPRLAARNATLLLLLLMACRPEWANVEVWLSETLRLARRFHPTESHPFFDLTNTEHRVRFTWDARLSRATLQVAHVA